MMMSSVGVLVVSLCSCSDMIQTPSRIPEDTRPADQLVEFAARVINAASAGTLPKIGVY